MSFVIHTEKLNLVSAVAEAEHDVDELQVVAQDERSSSSLREETNGGQGTVGVTHPFTECSVFAQPANATAVVVPKEYRTNNTFIPMVVAIQTLQPSHQHEMMAVFHLFIPTVIIQLGGTVPGFVTASYIGRNYPDIVFLDGFTLAMLTGNLFTLSLCQGLFTASDTLSPQAYGAGNKVEVGLLAIRGFIGSMLVTVPIMILLGIFMDKILIAVGEDMDASKLAWHWYQIYALGTPFYALYNVTWKFLSAQNVMMPLVFSVLVSCGIVLPLSMNILGSMYGYYGTAVCTVQTNIDSAL